MDMMPRYQDIVKMSSKLVTEQHIRVELVELEDLWAVEQYSISLVTILPYPAKRAYVCSQASGWQK